MAPSRDKLRIMTLNTHSLMEADTNFCLETLASAILSENADIVALQEVNQPFDAPVADAETLRKARYVAIEQNMPIRTGNFALELNRRLQNRGGDYQWTWAYNHLGYWRFDEGVALLSRPNILQTASIHASSPEARCARVLAGIQTEQGWFFSVHMGWWQDAEDPFAGQWSRINALCRRQGGVHYLMGDFNSPAHRRNEGYDRVTADGWIDCHLRAQSKDDGITVGGQIDGWRKEQVDPMRIDFIFTDALGTTLSSRVIFNGSFYPVISDHRGVLIEEALV